MAVGDALGRADEGTFDGDTVGIADMIGTAVGATGRTVGETAGANDGGTGTKAAVGTIVGTGAGTVGVTGDAVGETTGRGALVDRTGRALGTTAGLIVGNMGAMVFITGAGVKEQVGGTAGALVGDKVGTIAAYIPRKASYKANSFRSASRMIDRSNLRSSIS